MSSFLNPYRFGFAVLVGNATWRLQGLANASGDLAASEIEFFDTFTGTDLCSGGTPSASSEASSTFAASKAFDNSTSTYWTPTASSGYNNWIQYVFSRSKTAKYATWTARNDSSFGTSPTSLKIIAGGADVITISLGDGFFRAGEVKKFPTQAIQSTVTHTVPNGNAETGTTSGWTSETGTLQIRSASPSAYAGTYYFMSSSSATGLASQATAIDITSDGVSATNIDNERCFVKLDYWQNGFNDGADDRGGLGVRFIDVSNATISESYDTQVKTSNTLTWKNRVSYHPIPANTRKIKILIAGTRATGTNLDAYFDNITCATVTI